MAVISVIVPAYNVGENLGRCIKSIQTQSFKETELIVIDDGSSDGCGLLCDEHAFCDANMITIHTINGGVSSARNIGIDVSNGEYITFVDSDDYINEDFLQTFIDNSSDLTIAGYAAYDENGKLLYTHKYEDNTYDGTINYAKLCGQLLAPVCKLFRTEIIERFCIRFPEEYSWGEDAIFVASYVRYVEKIKVLSYVGYSYVRYNNHSTLSTRIRKDIVETISTSREKFLEHIEEVSGEDFEEIRSVIQEEIRRDCAYFVSSLFYLEECSVPQRKRLLQHFMKNKYVSETINQREKYYYDAGIRAALDFRDSMMAYWIISRVANTIARIKQAARKLLAFERKK